MDLKGISKQEKYVLGLRCELKDRLDNLVEKYLSDMSNCDRYEERFTGATMIHWLLSVYHRKQEKKAVIDGAISEVELKCIDLEFRTEELAEVELILEKPWSRGDC